MEVKAEKTVGMLAQFETAADLYTACERVRDAGFTKWDAHTPFPVHGLDKAMGLKPSKIPWFCFAMAMLGCGLALLMQWWMNAVDYPFIISGKPIFSWPANIPITFELSVLFCAAGAVLGLLGFCKLPRWYHPLFKSDRFLQATNDKFFISI